MNEENLEEYVSRQFEDDFKSAFETTLLIIKLNPNMYKVSMNWFQLHLALCFIYEQDAKNYEFKSNDAIIKYMKEIVPLFHPNLESINSNYISI